jgi:putative hemolysin
LFFSFFVVLICLTAINVAFRRIHRKDSQKQLELAGKGFFYRYLSRIFFPKQDYKDLYFAILFTQNWLRFSYTICCLLILEKISVSSRPFDLSISFLNAIFSWPLGIAYLCSFFLLFFFIGDYIARVVGTRYAEFTIRFLSPISSIFMVIGFPFIFIFLKILHYFSNPFYFDPLQEPTQEVKQELIDLIEASNFSTTLDPHDKKLIESVMEFKDRIAREIMVPRVDIFSLSHDTTIEEAAISLYKEGYSRTPVYKDTLDNIIGVLMYKDILIKYMESSSQSDKKILEIPIETLVKNILYTPETKKISHLLQEFRKQQVHLASIVDEYGGTEGIVTIEDILEEIVGDIADEYDDEEALFLSIPGGAWLIDARMSILDIEEQLGIEIPQDGDYDTMGGYIFHETGTIPTKGFIIQKPDFEIEVVRSNGRRVEKVRIKSLSSLH